LHKLNDPNITIQKSLGDTMTLKSQIEYKSKTAKTVSIAGSFNEWCGSESGNFDPNLGKMEKNESGLWLFSVSDFKAGKYQYKFIVDGKWDRGLNQTFHVDEKGQIFDPTGGIERVTLESYDKILLKFKIDSPPVGDLSIQNFKLTPTGSIEKLLYIENKARPNQFLELICKDISINTPLKLTITGLDKIPVTRPVLFDGIFRENFISFKKLGVTIESEPETTILRVFSPRATSVKLQIFSDKKASDLKYEAQGWKDQDGVWEMKAPGLWWGLFYGFKITGSNNEDEGFKPATLWADPYSKANVFHSGPSIFVNPKIFSDGFNGWTDQNFKTPAKEDLVIWEASIRDLTTHDSSDTPPPLKGKFSGLTNSRGKGTGIDHAKDLGVNAVEFLPIFEYDDDPPGSYHWGYMPSLFFAPEASYAMNNLGGQVNELKALIDSMHNAGLGVILDVVYNHTGKPQVLMGFDKQYYYRHDGEMSLLNYSGCGNDLKTENPMTRRLIIESLKYWVQEFHVDGFDLAELIDLTTLSTIESELQSVKPDVILITEPWSYRGSLKGKLKNTSWSHWNDDFGKLVKDAAIGKISADKILPVITGFNENWSGHPLESVNYVESHDNFTLADFLSSNPDKNGTKPSDVEIRKNLLCAAITLLSPGIPMIAAGQELLRSKKGSGNSYKSGDEINGINYSRKKQYSAVYEFYQGLIELRKSSAFKIVRTLANKDCQKVKSFYVPSNGIAIFWHDQLKPTNSLLIMFNTSPNRSTTFELSLISGKWKRLVGECKVFGEDSLNHREIYISHREKDEIELTLSPLGIEVWQPIK